MADPVNGAWERFPWNEAGSNAKKGGTAEDDLSSLCLRDERFFMFWHQAILQNI
ncbi:MAG: hypothetical protein ACOX6S_02495 [Clostridia bacterium]|jgi:hypothetical protein